MSPPLEELLTALGVFRLLDWMTAALDTSIARHPFAWHWLEWDWLHRITNRWLWLMGIAAVLDSLTP